MLSQHRKHRRVLDIAGRLPASWLGELAYAEVADRAIGVGRLLIAQRRAGARGNQAVKSGIGLPG